MVMSISNYSGTPDTFTWPHNPQVHDASTGSNYEIQNIDFQRHHILVSGGGIPPKPIILTGHFDGVNKRSNYQDLSKHFQENQKLKKLYWESDKFYLGVGKNCKETNSGGRTNFLDYVASFETIIGILLDDTQQTATSGVPKTNSGDVTTFIEEISGTVTNGANPITVTDNLGNELTIPATALTTGQAIVITFVKMVDSGSGIFVSEYNYVTIAGTQTKRVQTTGGFGIIQLEATKTTADLTITNLTSWSAKFRDGWSA